MFRKLQLLWAASLLCSFAFAQIPNNGFESWTGNAIQDWVNTNGLMQLGNPQTVFKSTDAHSGSSACEVITAKVVSKPSGAYVPDYTGSLFLGKQFLIFSYWGYPFSEKPTHFSFYYKYNARNQDTAVAFVATTKWNSAKGKRDTLSIANIFLTDSVYNYTKSTTALTRLDSISTPDSVMISFSAASNNTTHAGARLLIDDLEFSGGTMGISDNDLLSRTIIYPNPVSSGKLIVETPMMNENMSVQISNLEGRTMLETSYTGGVQVLDVSSFSPGIYLISIKSHGSILTRKIMVE